MNLNLLFTKDGLQYQLRKNSAVIEENSYFLGEETAQNLIENSLENLLQKPNISNISVISALNKFALAPETFTNHDLGQKLISFNSNFDENEEEMMLSVNKKFGVQFYFCLPKKLYNSIKNRNLPTNFNYSGEKFLNSISPKNGKEIHINLYHNQCEFFAFDQRKLLLYNNLDIASEVDFLYFIMFTISKLGFDTQDTQYFVYGETTENETFISELRKFVKNLKIVVDNLPKKNFILN